VRKGRPMLPSIFSAFVADPQVVPWLSCGRGMALVCGPREMVDSVSDLAFQHGLHFHSESFEL